MAVHTAHLAARHLGVEPRQADVPARQLHHAVRLRAEMVELEDAGIPLTTVDAARCDKGGDDVTDVALLSLGSPRTDRPVEIEPPPSGPRRGASAMAARAHDVAALELQPQHPSFHAASDERGDFGPLRTDVVELEDDRIVLPTISARTAAQMFKNELLGLLYPLRLERVVPASVSRSAFRVVPLEARATPPLACIGEPVELGRRSV